MADYPISKDTAVSLYDATNRARTTLVGSLSPSDLVVTLASGSAFPTASFLISINDEIMWIDSRVGNVLTVNPAGRGFENTVASIHAADSIVSNAHTALQRNNLRDVSIDMQNYLWTYRGTVITSTTTDPSTLTPATGDQHLVPRTGAIGDWLGQDDNLAVWDGTAWEFIPPEDAFSVFDLETRQLLRYRAATTAWQVEDGTIRDPFDPDFEYQTGDLVIYNLKLYRANKTIPAGAPFSILDWDAVHRTPTLEPWDIATEYFRGDMVGHLGFLWALDVDTDTGTEPGFDLAVWVRQSGTQDWEVNRQYAARDIVVHVSQFWIALVDVTTINPEPGTGAAAGVWEVVSQDSGEWVNQTLESGVFGTLRCRFIAGGAGVLFDMRIDRAGANIGTGQIGTINAPYRNTNITNAPFVFLAGHKPGQDGTFSRVIISSDGSVVIDNNGSTQDMACTAVWWI
jgi:hypothetical protein